MSFRPPIQGVTWIDEGSPYPLGWGQRLALLFARLGFRKRPGCGCAARARLIDRYGPTIAAVALAVALFMVLQL